MRVLLFTFGLCILATCVWGFGLLFRLWRQRQLPAENIADDSMPRPPADIDQAIFLKWRSPKRGVSNPHEWTNAVWQWLVETKLNAYQANKAFGGPSSMDAGPCWCFDRFGQSETSLPDGRIVYVAGEHEDFYDPDFYIYNDVVVVDTAGNVQIFCYPTTNFHPTDFHTATLVGKYLILIGNLGYADARHPGQTQVLRLEIDTWSVSSIETSGECPGWISRHRAELSQDGREIHIVGGLIQQGDESSLVENIDEWSLNLETFQWRRLTRRQWPRFILRREDKKWNHLFEMRNLVFERKIAERDKKYEKRYVAAKKELKKKLGSFPDLTLLEMLYKPDIATEVVSENILEDDEEDFNTHRIRVDGVTVRYVEDMYEILLTVEGDLPQEVIEVLKTDVVDKLAALERSPIVCEAIPFE